MCVMCGFSVCFVDGSAVDYADQEVSWKTIPSVSQIGHVCSPVGFLLGPPIVLAWSCGLNQISNLVASRFSGAMFRRGYRDGRG